MRKTRIKTWGEAFYHSHINRPKNSRRNDFDSSQSPTRIARCPTTSPAQPVALSPEPSVKVKLSSRCRALILSPLRLIRVFAERKRLYRKNEEPLSDEETASGNEKDCCKLGEGSFGAVFRHVYNNRDVAIKLLHGNRHSCSSDFHSFCSELNAFRLPPSPYIVGAVSFTSGIQMQVVTEFVEGRNLRQLINDDNWNTSDKERLRLAFQVISGVLHCHDHLLLHLDVKPANIIVDTRGKSCKLSDFGCSRIASSFENGILIASEKTTCPNFGTVAYVAPELFKGQKATDRADIFSFSLVLWELLTRSTAYDVMHPHILIYGVVVRKLRPDTGILTVDGKHCKALVTLLESCWSDELKNRPCAAVVQQKLKMLCSKSNTFQKLLESTKTCKP